MSTKPTAGRVRKVYEFIKAHRHEHRVQAMCRHPQRLLRVARAAGLRPWSSQEDARLLRLIRALFTASQGIYGPPRVFLDLRETGETCSKQRVARLMPRQP